MLLKIVRKGLGAVIVGIDKMTRPKPIERSPEEQAHAQGLMEGLSLYQLHGCPFCIKTRRAIFKLNVNMDIRDIGDNVEYRNELASNGGRVMVPCLRIEEGNHVRWMYESNDIIDYLETRVA
ncbi:glutaredoxin family protein [Agarilytica rhodophyticola]|uniref:glutaredoxin family protein n=1 Tax=Agarilytica rhodophyticola TaxID=1737490 RepID=UPI000B348E27|nr:glutaredoxin [Agarilytica rhodophyticola]